VGAPEALVIGVVALLVFGPKGLADIAKQLGQTLRAFQPTIKELQEVSREFRDTLEDEIGLDEIRNDIAGVTAPGADKETSARARSRVRGHSCVGTLGTLG
jgi:TatA/E family protein of Tat protein translocase